MMTPSDEQNRLRSMLVPALFWSTFSFATVSYLIFRVVVPAHLALEPFSARIVWSFFLEADHPARMATVGMVELIIGWLCFLHFHRNGVAEAVLKPGRFGSAAIVWTIVGTLVLPFVVSMVIDLVQGVFGLSETQVFKDGQSAIVPPHQLLAFFVVTVCIAPVIEEFLFRGAFLGTALASGWSVPLAVVVSSLGFVFIHGQYTIVGLIMIFMLSVWMSALRLWSGGLVLPMIAHAVNNLKFCLLSLLVSAQA